MYFTAGKNNGNTSDHEVPKRCVTLQSAIAGPGLSTGATQLPSLELQKQ